MVLSVEPNGNSIGLADQIPANPRSKVVIASLVGTTIEFYDFYVYATAAVLVFPYLFFADDGSTVSLMASLAVFGSAMLARPLGAFYFGHIGDKYGRKSTLVGALLTMGISTFLIGFLPTYQMVGWIAPALLTILRLGQGFALGGEWSGAALVAIENAPAGKRAKFGTYPQLGSSIGFILASGLFLIIAAWLPSDDPSRPSKEFLDWGWRIPFLFSAVMVVLGLWIRLSLVESTAFKQVTLRKKTARLPMITLFQKYKKEIILGIFYMLATYVQFYLMTTFVLSYGRAAIDAELPGLGYDYTDIVKMLVVAMAWFGVFTYFSGWLSERISSRKILLGATFLSLIYGLSWIPLISLGTIGIWLWLILGCSLMGLTYGPIGSLLPDLYPAYVRYTGSGIAYNLSSILGGAIAPFAAVGLWTLGEGSPFWVGLYLSSMACVTLIALIVGWNISNAHVDA